MNAHIFSTLAYSLFAVFALLFFLASLLSYKRVKEIWETEQDFQANGVIVEGSVTHHRHPAFFLYRTLSYRYQYEGTPYQNTQQVNKEDYERLQDGTSVRVCYLSHDPQISILIDLEPVGVRSMQLQNYFVKNSLFFAVMSTIAAIILFIGAKS